MHAIKITPNLLFEYQCTSGKFIRLPNRIESKLFLPELECSTGDIAENTASGTFVLWVETIRLQYLIRRGAGCRAVLVCVPNGITSRYISQLGN